MSPAEKLDEWQKSVEGRGALDALAVLEWLQEDVRKYEKGNPTAEVLDSAWELGPDQHAGITRALGTLEAFIRARM
ncbi:hypothetical protein [Nocardioides massiliensis]|uniref:Uncharacterized protein n=1 Tax=Nocardioides massiliensis TaxID=1325935 RepID=A0ABT9NJ90_9ACTN|nr:hypothetical protein [Nocardioides massiliensis]MDP9820464.1 hypothetical protein [Nocardioides massiliensis]